MEKMGSNEKTFAIIALCGIIGIIFAIVLQVLTEQGINMAQFLSNNTLTLPMLQVLVIVVWEVIGIVVAAVES